MISAPRDISAVSLNATSNNFDGVRILLAFIVFMAHAGILSQQGALAQLPQWFDSDFAVRGFFAISGFLITRSYLNSTSLWGFAEKRIRRIYPAYVTVVVFCLLLGMAFTTLPLTSFIADSTTWKYLAANLAFANFLQPSLPNVFDGQYLDVMNGSLWTIKIELCLYFCTPFIVFFYRHIGISLTTALIWLGSVGWVWFFTHVYQGAYAAELSRQFPGQLSYYVLGAFLAVHPVAYRRMGWALVVALIAWLVTPSAAIWLNPLFYPLVVLFLATQACQNLRMGQWGDVSYGIYLFHFPVVQSLVALGVFAWQPWIALCLAFAITWGLSLLSWHGVEKRMLRRNNHYRKAARDEA